MRRSLLAGCAALALASTQPRPAAAQDAAVLGPLIIEHIRRTIQSTTQISNYFKGLMSGIMQNTDADNVADLRVQRDFRKAQIRDEHIPTPAACEAVDETMAAMESVEQSWVVAHSLGLITDPRGEGQPNMPAYVGQTNALAASRDMHAGLYCSEAEAADGWCSLSEYPNADQRAWYMSERFHYPRQPDIDAAMSFATTLSQPLPVRHLRATELRSAKGQEAAAVRRWQNALWSLARSVTNEIVGRRVPTVTLNDAQKAQMAAQGLTPTDRGSWHLVMQLAVERRAGTAYQAALQRMPPGARMIEQANTAGLSLAVQWEIYKKLEKQNAMLAAQVSALAEEGAGGRFQEAIRYLNAQPEPQVQ